MGDGKGLLPDVDHAMRRVRARLEELNHCGAQLRRWAATCEQQDEGREELSEYARSADAPEELRLLQRQIDRGELLWYATLAGEADGVIDRRVGAFLADRLASLEILGEALRSGASAEEAAALMADNQGSVTR